MYILIIVRELFSKEEIERFFNVMLVILEKIFENPKQKVAEIKSFLRKIKEKV